MLGCSTTPMQAKVVEPQRLPDTFVCPAPVDTLKDTSMGTLLEAAVTNKAAALECAAALTRLKQGIQPYVVLTPYGKGD